MKFTATFVTIAFTALVATAAAAAPAISNDGNSFGADMTIVHQMLFDHAKIKRAVTNLSNGIRTITESDDPQVALLLKAHVKSMLQRLKEGNVFNVASRTLPVIFANSSKIRTEIEETPKGIIITQTSSDPATVAALQGHAGEVSDLARGGMPALMRQVMANGGQPRPEMAQMMQQMMHAGGPMGGMQH